MTVRRFLITVGLASLAVATAVAQNPAAMYFPGNAANRARITDASTANLPVNPAAFALAGTSITVEAWVYPMGVPGAGQVSIIVDRPSNTGIGVQPFQTYGLLIIGPDAYSPVPVLAFAVSDGVNPIGAGFETAVRDTAVVRVGEWTHVAGTYDGSTVKLYINGVLTSSTPFSVSLGTGSTGFYVGGTVTSGFKGLIDEVRIWNVPRLQVDIQNTMSTTLSGSEAGLAGYWPMNVDNAPAAGWTPDLTSNSNDLVIQNGAKILAFPFNSVVSLAPTAVAPATGYAVANAPFVLHLSGDGWPAPTYSILSAPAGMSLAGDSLSWVPTPADNGNHLVIFTSTNSAGSVTDTVQVFVENVLRLENSTRFDVTNRGKVGTFGSYGGGIVLNSLNGLYAADVSLVDRADTLYAGGLYTGANSFAPAEGFTPVASVAPGFSAVRTSYTDAWEQNRMYARVIQTSYIKQSAPDDHSLIVEYKVVNESGVFRSDLFAQVSADFDVGVAGNNLAGYDTSLGLVYAVEAGGATNPQAYGVQILRGPISGMAVWTVNDQNFVRSVKNLTTFTAPITVPGDVRGQITVGPFALAPSETLSFMAAYHGAPTLDQLRWAAARAKQVVNDPATVSGLSTVTESEPNNYAGDANIIPFDINVNGSISTSQDVDYFTFTLAAPDTVQIIGQQADSSGLIYRFEVFDNVGSMVYSSWWYRSSDAAPYGAMYLNPGTYTVRVLQFYNYASFPFKSALPKGSKATELERSARQRNMTYRVASPADTSGGYVLTIRSFTQVLGRPGYLSIGSINENSVDAWVYFAVGEPNSVVEVEYGTTTAYGSSQVVGVYSPYYDYGVYSHIIGLQPARQYHVRIKITGTLGTAYGSDHVISTPQASNEWAVQHLPDGYTAAMYGVKMFNDRTGYASGDGIFRTTNGGMTWEGHHPYYSYYHYSQGMAFWTPAQGASVGYGTEPLVLTSDSGNTWTAPVSFPSTVSVREVGSYDGSSIIAAGYNGMIIRSNDYGATWSIDTISGPSMFTGVVFTAPSTVMLIDNNGGVYRSVNGGQSWTLVQTISDALYSLSFADASTGYIGGYYGMYSTTDGGVSWSPISGSPQYVFGISMSDAQHGYGVSYNGTIWRTADGWQTPIFEPSGVGSGLLAVDQALGGVTVTGELGTIVRKGPVHEQEPNAPVSSANRGSYNIIDHGVLDPDTDVDYISFDGAAGDTVDISVTTPVSATLPYGVYLQLFDAIGTRISVSDFYRRDPLTGSIDRLVRVIPSTGKYYIRISDPQYDASSWPNKSITEEQPPSSLVVAPVKSKTVGALSDYVLMVKRGGSVPPAVTTAGVVGLFATRATVVASVLPNGSNTTVTLEYGTTPALGSTAPADEGPATGLSAVARSSTLQGLLPSTTYYYRWTATNAFGTDTMPTIDSLVTPGSPDRWATQTTGTLTDYADVSFEPNMYSGMAVGFSNSAVRTTDGGQSWQPMTIPPVSPGVIHTFYAVKMFDFQNAVVAGTSNLVKYTTDGGNTWTQASLPSATTWRDMSFYDRWNGLLAGSLGKVMRTFDGGHSWIELAPLPGLPIAWALQMIDPSTFIAVGSTGSAYFSYDGGGSWIERPVVPGFSLFGVSFFNASEGIVAGDNGIVRRTTDGGITWFPSAVPIAPTTVIRKAAVSNPTTAWLAAWDGNTYRTTDKGISWTTSPTGFGGILRTIRYHSPNVMLASGTYGLVFVRDIRPPTVYFYADMKYAMRAGMFDPAKDSLVLRGSLAPLDWTSNNYLVSNPGGDSIYYAQVMFPDTGHLEYKFVIRHRGSDFWERSYPYNANRMLDLIRQPVGYMHYFNDLPLNYVALPGQYGPAPNVIGLWHLDEGAPNAPIFGAGGEAIFDQSSSSLTGTATGTTVVPGRWYNAREFNGTTDGISLERGFFPPSGTPSVTMEAWISMSAYPSGHADILYSGGIYDAFLAVSSEGRLRIGIKSSLGYQIDSLIVPLSLNRWQHVALEYDAAGRVLLGYLDGQLVINHALGVGFAPASGPDQASIGVGPGGAFHFLGAIDEVRVSDRLVPPAEFNLVLPPSALNAVSSNHWVQLSWPAAVGGTTLSKYRVYRGADSLNVALFDSTNALQTTFLDSSAVNGAVYYYRVRPVDVSGFEGRATVAARGTPLPYPAVVSVSPARNSTSSGPTPSIVLTFNTDLDSVSVDTSDVRVRGLVSGPMRLQQVTYVPAQRQIVVVPDTAFTRGEQVEVTLRTSIHNLNGDAPVAPLTGRFTIATVGGTGLMSVATVPGGSGSWAVALGDIDGDGDADLVTANSGGTISIAKNDGHGVMTPASSLPQAGTPHGVALLDVDNDGDLDMAVALWGAGAVVVWRNTGTGTFIAPITYPVGVNLHSIAAGDLNGDGMPDLAATDYAGGSIALLTNNGDGTFSPSSVTGLDPNPTGLVIADLNRDGLQDLAYVSFSGTIRWLRNVGSGFTTISSINMGGGSYGIVAGDVNNDGNVDLVAGLSLTSSNVRLVRLQANGSLLGTSTITVGSGAPDIRGVALGDVNGDGTVDLIAADYGNSIIHVLSNDGNGGYTEIDTTTVGSGPWELAVADLDGDGDLDLATGHGVQSYATILRNNVDNVAPLAPAELTVSETSSKVTLRWTLNAEPDIARYVIFRSPVPSPTPPRIDSVASGVATFLDQSVSDSVPVFYYVKAVDAAGNESPFSFTRAATPHARVPGEYTATDTLTSLLLPFAETTGSNYTVDASPRGQSSINFGGALPVSGRYGQARTFTGSQYLRFPGRYWYAPSAAFTVEAWVKLTGGGTTGVILRKDTSASSGYALTLVGAGVPQFQVYQPAATVAAPTALQTGVWTHIAGMYTGTQVLMYVNGQLVASSPASGPLTIANSFLSVGATATAIPTDYLNAVVDEVRLSQVERTAAEFNVQSPPKNLAASVAGTTINLAWQAGGGAVAPSRYRIYRSAPDGDSTTVSLVDSSSVTSYADADLPIATTFYYRVTTVDQSGFESGKSYAATKMTSSAPKVARATTFVGSAQGSTDSPPLFSYPEGTVLDGYGNVYVADGGNGSIRKITPNKTVTTLASGMGTVTGVVVDSAGNVFASSSNHHVVYRISATGNKSVWAGSGSPGLTDGADTSASFNSPAGLAIDGHGNIFVADRGNHVIRKINTSRVVWIFAGGGVSGFSNGMGLLARFNSPSGLRLDNSGNLFVADRDNNAIRKIVLVDSLVSTVAGLGPSSPGSVDGDASQARFNLPTGIATDAGGNLFVADRDNSLIRRISVSGITSTVGGLALSVGAVDDTASSARFYAPRDVVSDAPGNLYVADWGNHRIRRVITNYVPSVWTYDVTGLSSTTATLWGSVNPDTLLTTAYFEYGTSTSYGLQTTGTLIGLNSDFVTRSSSLTGLAPNTTYHYRMVGTNDAGTTLGTDRIFTTLLPAPGIPTPLAPDSGAEGLSVIPTLAWNAAANATNYRVQVSLVADFSTVLADDSTITSTSAQVGPLAHDTVFYWHVRAQNVSGASAYTATRFFRTIVDTPATPVLASPIDNATDQPVTATLSWNAAARATEYHLQVSPSNTFAVLTFEDSTLTGTSADVPGLANLTTYFWRVRAKNAGGTGAFSAVRQFTTIIALPADPTLAAPADLATGQPTSLSLTWNAAARASTYHLQLALDSLFTSLVDNDSTLATTTHNEPDLLNGTTYYWRVSAKNAAGVSNYSVVRKFTTIIAAPQPPALAAPDSGAVRVAVGPLSLVWNTASLASSYQVQLSTSSSFTSTVVNDSTVTGTTKLVGPLSNDQQYYWRVRSLNAGGVSAYSPVWTFRTVESIPDIVLLTAPADSVTNQPVSLPLSWSAAARAVTYRVEVATDTLFTSVAFVDSTLTATTRGVGPLSYSTTYFWRVRAQNAGGNGPYSQYRSFTTTIEPPSVPVLVSPDTTSTTVPTTATLVWRASARATTYRLQVSLFPNFGQNVLDQTGITDTSYQVPSLLTDTTYYWHVSATNTGGTTSYSSTWKFRTVIAQPDVPSLASPADLATGEPTTETFTWSTASRAASYRLEVSTQNNFASLYFVDSTIVGTSRQVTLNYLTTYFWRVRANNVGGVSGWSSVRQLTTIIQSPVTPVLWSPDSAVVDQPATLTLTWLRPARAASYRVQVSQNGSFSTTFADQSGVSDSSIVIGPLANNTDYYWRVNASNAGGTSGWSSVWRFRTVDAIPDVPVLLSPGNTQTGVQTSPNLVWNAAARAVSYRLQIATDATFTTNLQTFSGISGTSQIIPGLQNLTLYYWRVRAENAGGASSYSSAWQFTTIMAAPGAAPSLTVPADNAMNVVPTAAMSWTSVATAATYHLQISLVNSFASTVVDDATLTTTSTSPTGLGYSTMYYWRVRGSNAGGPGPWSVVRAFTTAPNVPVANLSPKPVDFGSVEGGQHFDNVITLTNGGGTNLNVTSVGLDGASAAEFAIVAGSGSFSVLPGGNRQFTVRFTPSTIGSKTARLVLQTNDMSQSGTGMIVDTLSGFATDNTPPNPTLTVTLSPQGWSRTNKFTALWASAVTDFSGVPTVWYSIDVPPTTGSPGSSTGLTGSSFEITAAVLGQHVLYFYFEDGAGNKEPAFAQQVVYKYDNVAPTVAHDTTTVPEVTVQNGVGDQDVSIHATGGDGQSGVQSLTLFYRRVSDVSYVSVPMVAGTATIPAATFGLNGGPIGVDYRIVAADSAGNQTATKTYSVRVRAASAPPPQPNPLPAASALPAGTDVVKAYRMFSVPYNLTDKKPSSVLPVSLGSHALNGVQYANWRFQRYIGGLKQDYETFKDADALAPGAGFFLIVRETNKRVTVGAGSVVNAQEMNDVGISLQAGWNLVGDPLLADILVDSLRTSVPGTLQQLAYFDGGSTSGWNLSPTALKVWEGLAVKVSQPTNLLFRTIGSQPGMAEPDLPVARLNAHSAVRSDESIKNWLMTVDAHRADNDMMDIGTTIGMVDGADDGLDRFDKFHPPFVGIRNVAVYYATANDALVHDLRSVNADGGVWEMRLMTGDAGAKITLDLGGADRLPDPAFEAFLIDLDQRMAYNLRSTSQISVNSGDGERHFRIVVGQKAFVNENRSGVDLYPQTFSLFANYPNPFNPETILRYTVPDGAGTVHVSLKVYDMLGREVATVVDQQRTAGYFEVPFNAGGLSSGAYFYRLTITDAAGRGVYSKVRNMLFVK